MKRLLLASACALGLAVTSASAQSPPVLDPLHGVCLPGPCAGAPGGSSLQFSTGAFGFIQTGSGNPLGGDLRIEILVPNIDVGFTLPSVTETLGNPGGLSQIGSAVQFTTGDLSTALGLTPASPSSPFSAFAGQADAEGANVDATGYTVYSFDAGNFLPNGLGAGTQGNPRLDAFTLGGNLPSEATIVAFLSQPDGSFVATSPSEQLIAPDSGTFSVPGPQVGGGPAGLAFAAIAMIALGRNRQFRMKWFSI